MCSRVLCTACSFFLNRLVNFMGVGFSLYGLAALYQYFSQDPIIKHTIKCRYCRKRINEKVSGLLIVVERGRELTDSLRDVSTARAGRTAGRSGILVEAGCVTVVWSWCISSWGANIVIHTTSFPAGPLSVYFAVYDGYHAMYNIQSHLPSKASEHRRPLRPRP